MTISHDDYKDEKCERPMRWKAFRCGCAERAFAKARELAEAWQERFTRLSAVCLDDQKRAQEQAESWRLGLSGANDKLLEAQEEIARLKEQLK